MKYNMFKGMVHLVGTLQARIQGGGGGFRTSDLKFQQAKNKKEVKRERERGQLWGKQVIFIRLFVPLYFFFFQHSVRTPWKL